MTRALRFLASTTPAERAAAFRDAWWALPLAAVFVVLFAAATP